MLSSHLEVSINLAVSEAARRRHEYVTVEHLCYALLHNTTVKDLLNRCEVDIDELREELEGYFDDFLDHNALLEGDLPSGNNRLSKSYSKSCKSHPCSR